MTLDIVHCFQSRTLGTEAGFEKQVPAWAWEGPAEFINLEAWPGITQSDAISWLLYFGSPEDSLFVRSYDAIGFYSQLRQSGGDLSMAFRAVLTDVDDPERFALTGATSNAFLDTWASGLAHSNWDGAWTFDGPGIPDGSVQAPKTSMGVANGSNEAVSQDAYTNELYFVDSDADIVQIDMNGRGRVGDGAVDMVVAGTAMFCTTDKGCGPCPDGSKPPIQPVRLVNTFLLAVSGGTDGTNGFVSGHPLEEFCKPSPQVCESGGAPAAVGDLPTLGVLIVSRSVTAAGDCPTPSPTDDEFCRRWRDFLDWARGQGDDITRERAAEIVERFVAMQPVAPAEMVPHVKAVILTYRTFAQAPGNEGPLPIQVPLTGLTADRMYHALLAIDGYCGTNAFPTS
jgi:hypothetical protein